MKTKMKTRGKWGRAPRRELTRAERLVLEEEVEFERRCQETDMFVTYVCFRVCTDQTSLDILADVAAAEI
jgi:hypothetical protein